MDELRVNRVLIAAGIAFGRLRKLAVVYLASRWLKSSSWSPLRLFWWLLPPLHLQK